MPKHPKPEVKGKSTEAPIPTSDVIARLRAAGSVDDAVAILSPTVSRPMVDATYELAANVTTPLPQRRGVCLRVYAVAVRLDKPFKVADVTAALPDVKSAAYWTRRLAKDGFFRTVE